MFLTRYAIALGADAVALKSRQAAVSDTYANQGARAGAILPFTSATASLCAAVTVAVVELLPIIPSVLAQSAAVAVFPLCGSFVAAAATISKARCEVDAEAATAAANELSRTDREVETLTRTPAPKPKPKPSPNPNSNPRPNPKPDH